tara:strand:- start:43844 stop:45949 length:2106 start_codon:yes stop_codon:yes gene_type:complete
MEELGTTLFRINLSHTKISDLPGIIKKIQSYTNTPICLDSEGAQIRTGELQKGSFEAFENEEIFVLKKRVPGNKLYINFTPKNIIDDLQVGDFISIDFNSVLTRVTQVSLDRVTMRVLNGGVVGQNKAVTVNRFIQMAPFTEKDLQAFKIGEEMGIKNFALSFAHKAKDVEDMRALFKSEVSIISKIECRSGVNNLDGIANASDGILIDRGDLSREVPIEKIPFVQKEIIKKAKQQKDCSVYVATNLLESMILSPTPTRAEVNDIYNTLADGADGLVLAAETAIGKFPVRAVEMVSKLIHEFQTKETKFDLDKCFAPSLSFLPKPHGGKLIDQSNMELSSFNIDATLEIDLNTLLDVEQIAYGVYSPITGFMNQDQLNDVLDNYSYEGTAWTLPILLQISREQADSLKQAKQIKCTYNDNDHSVIEVDDIYELLNKNELAEKWFTTSNISHPGVRKFIEGGDFCIAGKVFLVNKLFNQHSEYQYRPQDLRYIFNQKGWRKVVGFHTRNVPHRAHEFIQKKVFKESGADGLLINPVVGPKKKGDFLSTPIISAYQSLIDFGYYPSDSVLLSVFATYSRYAGPREAVFTALCRKNMGCSHFVIGRDHTGVGSFYPISANIDLFTKIGDIGIQPVFLKEYRYNAGIDDFQEFDGGESKELKSISGTQVRELLSEGKDIEPYFIREVVQDRLKEIAKTEGLFYNE